MTSLIPVPKPLDISNESRSHNWELFKQSWHNYELATGMAENTQERRVATLLSIVGYDALRVYNAFHWTTGEAKTIESVLYKFECYCKPKLNITYERFSFMSRKQKADENINDYIVTLRNLIKNCGYEQLTDSIIRDAIVMGIRNKRTQENLLRENDLTLEKCVNIVRAAERAQQHFNYISEEKSSSRYEMMEVDRVSNEKDIRKYCKFCGSSHIWGRNRCPAYGKTCSSCGGKNHFGKVCKKIPAKHENVKNIECTTDQELFQIH